MDDENFKAEMDKDTIEALVRYTRHSDSEYTGMNVISNEYAYELLTEFFNKKYNIANFYENLENYDKLNDLVTKAFNIKSDKESLVTSSRAAPAIIGVESKNDNRAEA